MIYTDGAHVISNISRQELSNWARAQGIKRHFFHYGRHLHYDIPKGRRKEKFPAQYVTTRELVRISKAAALV